MNKTQQFSIAHLVLFVSRLKLKTFVVVVEESSLRCLTHRRTRPCSWWYHWYKLRKVSRNFYSAIPCSFQPKNREGQNPLFKIKKISKQIPHWISPHFKKLFWNKFHSQNKTLEFFFSICMSYTLFMVSVVTHFLLIVTKLQYSYLKIKPN